MLPHIGQVGKHIRMPGMLAGSLSSTFEAVALAAVVDLGLTAWDGAEVGESDPVCELKEIGGRLPAASDQGGDGLADGGVAAGVLGRGLTGLPERGDCLVPVPGPAVGARRLDVEVGAALGGQGPRWPPLRAELEGAANVVTLDSQGELVDADAARAEGGAVVNAVRYLLGGCAGLGEPVGRFLG
jgi:hypothetical protein